MEKNTKSSSKGQPLLPLALFSRATGSKLASFAFAAVAAVALSVPRSAQAATTYYWDTTATSLWATGANWSTDPNSGGTTGVVPAAGDSVVFNQSTINGNETVQLGANASITGMTFANTGTTLLESNSATPRVLTFGGVLTLNSGAGAVTIGDATNVLNVSLTQNVNTVTLNGSAGVTFVNLLTNANSASNITFTVNGAGNTLNLGDYNLGNGSGGKTITINGSGNVRINGAVADNSTTASSILYTGSGTLTLVGNNTYTGNTTIGGGGTVVANSIVVNGGASNLGNSTSAVIFNAGNGTVGKLSYTGNSATFTRGFSITNASTFAEIDTTTAGQTLTISTGNVTFAASSETLIIGGAGNTTITSNISGGGKLTKNDSGTLLFSGTNTSASGKTTINGGTLEFGIKSSLYNGGTSSWTAANITAASGATLAVGVDSAGTNGFTATDVNTLLANVSVATTGSTGLQAGASVGFDTTNATGGTFTQGNAIADSTGANGGSIGVTKLGTGALVLDKTNTYTGATTVKGGTLTVNGSIVSAATVNSGAVLNGAGTTGAVTVSAGGTLAGTLHVGAITGAGTVAPGNSPGILTASSVTLGTGGENFKFELTAAAPTYNAGSGNSANDVVHLTGGTPLNGTANSSNTFDIYLGVTSISAGNTFDGGIFTDLQADFLASVSAGTYNYYILGDGGGTHAYNGVNYYTLSEYDALVSNTYAINVSTVTVPSANFADGTITNGREMEFGVVIPEPGTYAMVLGGFGMLIGFQRMRRRNRA